MRTKHNENAIEVETFVRHTKKTRHLIKWKIVQKNKLLGTFLARKNYRDVNNNLLYLI